jgi:hypothetical protein
MSDTFGCWLYLTICEKDAIARLSRWVEMPFVPFKGLRINLGDDDDPEIESFDVEKIEYNTCDGGFWLHQQLDFGDDCECTPDNDCCRFNEQRWIDSGWTIDKVSRGDDRYPLKSWMFPTVAAVSEPTISPVP